MEKNIKSRLFRKSKKAKNSKRKVRAKDKNRRKNRRTRETRKISEKILEIPENLGKKIEQLKLKKVRELNILESELNKLEGLKIKKIVQEIDELTNGSNNKLRIGSKYFS